jgi:hypothetical protein
MKTHLIKLNESDAGEVCHKMTTLAESPDLCEDYALTVSQAEQIASSVPHKPGKWEVPAWALEAVKEEMADHCLILDGIAADARNNSENGQALRIAKQAKRLRRLFA